MNVVLGLAIFAYAIGLVGLLVHGECAMRRFRRQVEEARQQIEETHRAIEEAIETRSRASQ